MDVAVFAGIEKTRMLIEFVFFGMFKDKPAIGQQDIPAQNGFRQFFKILQFKGRIGKDQIVFCFANSQKEEHIHFYCVDSLHIHFGCRFRNELNGTAVYIHQVNFPASAGIALVTDTACTAE